MAVAGYVRLILAAEMAPTDGAIGPACNEFEILQSNAKPNGCRFQYENHHQSADEPATYQFRRRCRSISNEAFTMFISN